ncbi:TonB-dependent receptor [Mucilaginibacter sp.]|uniref:TonB-dependent receptor n=1 Tax=Mucilaginibacter sp. TaxID=1882438 RepID=UPI00285011A2|nr:TonB-dependent receptor [Mucilaginibacter sp.]MDR3697678.1 TonB-dependent receptor [Mucilaginibacter sp.]
MKKFILFALAIFMVINAGAQNKNGNIKGTIHDTKHEPLAGMTVSVANTKLATTTNTEGVFNINHIPAGSYTLNFSGVGFKISKTDIVVKNGETTVVSLELNESTNELKEVSVRSAMLKKFADTISNSGTRLPLKLVETPQTIQVITHDILLDQQAQNLNDAAKNMTGVVSNNMYTSYTMRGFLNSYYNQFITVDGYMGNMYQWTQLIQLYNIDKVEEIAGPASALYSVGSPGGVINMVTKRPLDKEMYSFALTTGSWGLADISADLTGPLSKNKKLLYRLNVGYNYANSFRPYQFNQNLVIAPSLSYNFSEKTSINLDYTYAENKTRFGEDHGGLLLMNKDSTYNWKGVNYSFLFNSPKDFDNTTNNNITLRLNHKFSDNFQLTYMSRYIWSRVSSAEHYGNYYADNYLTALPDSIQRNYDTWKDNPYNFQNSVFATLSLGHKKIKQTIVAGADVQLYGDSYNRYVDGAANAVSSVNPDYSGDNFNYAINSSTYVYDVTDQTRVLGAYLQYLISLNNKFKFLISGRYENYFYKVRPNSADNYTSSNDTSSAHVFLPRFGVVYSLTGNQSVYASYCQSFQPQYDNARNSGGPFPPQKGKQYELGYKGLFFGGKLMSSVALYSINYVNILATDPADPTGVHEIVTPGLLSDGAEFTLQGNIKQFSIITGYAYNHVVFANNSPLGPKGGRYDNSPNHIVNGWIKYALPDESKIKGLSLSIGGKYVGDRVGEAANQHFIMPPYFVLDAAVNYNINRFNIALNGFNLLNNKYVLGYYASDLMVQLGTPENWKLSLRYTIK